MITCNNGKDDEKTLNAAYDKLSKFSVTMADGSEYSLTYVPEHNADDVKVYTLAQLSEMAAAYCERITGSRPQLMFGVFDANNRYSMEFMDGHSFAADPLGGKCFDMLGNEIDLTALPEIKDLFTAGLWSCRSGDSLKYYISDGKGNITVINAEDGSKETMKYNWIGTQAVEFTAGDKIEMVTAEALSDTEITLTSVDNQMEMLTYAGEKSLENTRFYSDKKLADMAAVDRSKKAGKQVKVSETVSSDDGTVTVRFDDGSEYRVDRFTGKGTDENGKAVDLPKTGISDHSFAAAAALITLGAAAVFVSRKYRRKEDC